MPQILTRRNCQQTQTHGKIPGENTGQGEDMGSGKDTGQGEDTDQGEDIGRRRHRCRWPILRDARVKEGPCPKGFIMKDLQILQTTWLQVSSLLNCKAMFGHFHPSSVGYFIMSSLKSYPNCFFFIYPLIGMCLPSFWYSIASWERWKKS